MLAHEWRKVPALLVAAVVLLAGCRAPGPQEAQPGSGAGGGPPAAREPAPPTPPRGMPTYRIDPAQSELRVLVYRAGTMAKLGHDHVIENHALTGWVGLAPGAAAASFYLAVPVAAFVIDDESARLAAGPEFGEPVDAEAKEGTRRNMLGPALLDAEHHALIALRSVAFQGAEPHLVATVEIDVAGHGSRLTIPVDVVRGDRRLTATVECPVRQTDLGLTPFSVMLGALRVADQINVRLKVVALAE
jgi:hypothetical protein